MMAVDKGFLHCIKMVQIKCQPPWCGVLFDIGIQAVPAIKKSV